MIISHLLSSLLITSQVERVSAGETGDPYEAVCTAVTDSTFSAAAESAQIVWGKIGSYPFWPVSIPPPPRSSTWQQPTHLDFIYYFIIISPQNKHFYMIPNQLTTSILSTGTSRLSQLDCNTTRFTLFKT